MSRTAIEWATHVYNPFTGCDRYSAACASCYAIPVAAANQRKELGRQRRAAELGRPAPRRRYANDGDPRTSGPGFGFTVHWDKLERPERFPAGARVFVNSMSDVFHERASLEAIAALWRVFASRPDVTWLVLTKRAQRMHDVLCAWRDAAEAFDPAVPVTPELLDEPGDSSWRRWIDGLPNVWVGVTVENRSALDRAQLLRDTPAAIRFVSAEPLLGPLVAHARTAGGGGLWWHRGGLVDRGDRAGLDLTWIDWLIAGGESGGRPGRRLIDEQRDPKPEALAWVRDLRDACKRSGTAFFFKQWGGVRATSGGRELDGRVWNELPGERRS